jgi:hypothetical protein
MMTLPPPLQTAFNQKLEQHEKELNMPFLSTIEEMAEERGEAKGEIKGARKTCRNNITAIFALMKYNGGRKPCAPKGLGIKNCTS